MSSTDEEQVTVPIKRKKGLKQVKYKSEEIKESHVKGKQYINWKGNTVSPNKQGEDCKCVSGCFKRVSEGDRKEVNDKFYNFNTKNEQDAYLQSLISIHDVARRRQVSNNNPKPKSHSYVYRISCSSGSYTVCKKAFGAIHGVSDNRIRRLYNLLSLGKSPIDERGKSRPGNAKAGYVIKQICDHIESFPVKEAHYTSHDYKYLSERLNVKLMHKLYLERHPNSDVKYNFYYQIFKERYSLSFGRPQVDSCVTCEELSVKIKSGTLNEVAKRVSVAEKMVHIRRSKKFFDKIKAVAALVKQSDDSVGICIDYMQNLELPNIPIQDMFYLRQLSVNIFNIHDLKTGKATIYLYHEGMAKKGANEVISFLNQYIKSLPQNIKNLYLFSDGCGGQAKNNIIIRYLLSLLEIGKIKSIEQYFPFRGHSYMPCDRDFGTIKRKIKTVDRTYTLKEYVEQVVTSSDRNKFTVVVPETNEILEFKKWSKLNFRGKVLSTESYGRNIPKERKVRLNVSRFKHFSYSSNYVGQVIAREFIDALDKHTFQIGTGIPINLPLEKAHPTGKIPLKKAKMEDLKKIANSLPHDPEVQTFWTEIYDWPTIETQDDNNESDNEQET